MKHFCYILMLLVLGCTTACIDEYNELPTGSEERMVVIEGQIVSGKVCTFSLRYTVGLDALSYAATQTIDGATVVVMGEDGQRFVGVPTTSGHYDVQVGELKKDTKYYVMVTTLDDGTFTSEPLLPIDAPELTEISYEQPREDRVIDYMVSTSNPGALSYFCWEYDETWEVNTPRICYWEYVFDNPEAFASWSPFHHEPDPSGYYQRIPMDRMTNRGWCYSRGRETLIATNKDYGQGALTKYCLFQRDPDLNRYQTRHLSRIRQMAISAQEYEYLHLMTTLSSEMGGLFTPMPSELPSNIRRSESNTTGTKAIGYIGVRGYVSEKEIYVNRKDVGHVDLYHVKVVPDSLVTTPARMMYDGYWLIDYDPYQGSATWSNRWVVDCTDPFWGASTQRPDYWKDEE